MLAQDAVDLGGGVVQAGLTHGWGEMVDEGGGTAPLGLGALAGVVDDVGVDVDHPIQGELRVALLGQAQPLAGKPFQAAVGAHMDDGVGLEDVTDPAVVGQVVVRGRQHRVVHGRVRDGLECPARWLDRQQHVAVEVPGEGELVVVDEEGARMRPPVAVHALPHGVRQPPVPGTRDFQIGVGLGPLVHLVGGEPALVAGQARQQHLGDVVAGLELFRDVVPLLAHPNEQLTHRLEGVQTGGTADAIIAWRMVMEDDRHLALTGRGASQPGPGQGQLCHRLRPARDRDHAGHDGSGEVVNGVDLPGGQELGDEGAVELRLRGLGGDVHRPHALGGGLPGSSWGVGGEGVQHTHPQIRVGVGIGGHASRHGHPVDVDQGVDDTSALVVTQQILQNLRHAGVAASRVGQPQAEERHRVGVELLDGGDEGLDVGRVVLQPVAAREGDADGGTVGVQVLPILGEAGEQAVTRMPDSLGGGGDDVGDRGRASVHPVDEDSQC